jgi:dienelactone hydrolase
MTEIVLYHHVQGLTEGVRSFADQLQRAGHTVHTPDLFDGRRFDSIDEGMAFIKETGFDDIRARDLKIRPYCPFVGAYLRRHPEYEDLVAT